MDAPFQAHLAVWSRDQGGYWWTVERQLQPTTHTSTGGWETTRKKAWRKACGAAGRAPFAPVS